MLMTLVKSLTPCALFLEQESYLSYINLNYKNLKFTIKFKIKIRIYNLHYNPQESYAKKLICNNCEKPIAAIKNRILYTFSTIRDVIDFSDKLNNNLALISLNFREPFSRVDWDFKPLASLFCHKPVLCKFILSSLILVMKTNSFT